MNENPDSLSYSGPNREYTPLPSSNREKSNQTVRQNPVDRFSIENLRSQLSAALDKANLIIDQSNKELSIFSLDLINSEKRVAAAKNTWEDFDISKHNPLPYNLLLQIENIDNPYINFLVNEFNKELRKPKGSSAVDVKKMASIIKGEIASVKTLVDVKLFEFGDSIIKRFIEIFVEWTDQVDRHLNILNSFFETNLGERYVKIPNEELFDLSSSDASKYQALFQVRVNAVNQDLDKNFSKLNTLFTKSSNFFYQSIVKQLLNIRVNISDEIYLSDQDQRMTSETFRLDLDAVNRNLIVAMYDLDDRKQQFFDIVSEIEPMISFRENYHGYIQQLEQKGSISLTDLSKTTNNFDLTVKSFNTNSFANDHNSLADREDLEAHIQYLIREGDTIIGDIDIGPLIKFGGIIPSLHAHDGEDGSPKIDGSNVQEKTLTTDSVNRFYNSKPENFQLIGLYGGGTYQEAKLFWQSKVSDPFHEISVSLVPTVDFVDPGQDGGGEEPTPIPTEPGYIPPFEANSPLFIEWLTQIDYELFFN